MSFTKFLILSMSLLFLLSFHVQATTAVSDTSLFSKSETSIFANFSFVSRNIEDFDNIENTTYQTMKVAGFSHFSHELYHLNNGFNVNTVGLQWTSTINQKLRVLIRTEFLGESLELSESHASTLSRWNGIQLKFGKFLSHFNRQNRLHLEEWGFADPALSQVAFFGERGLNEKGIQFLWTSEKNQSLKIGLEILQGENKRSFGTNGFSKGEVTMKDAPVPGLKVLFVNKDFNLSKRTQLYFGAGYASGYLRRNFSEGESINVGGDSVLSAFEIGGRTQLSKNSLSWNLERIQRELTGDAASTPSQVLTPYEKKHTIDRIEAFLGIDSHWKLGLRHEALAAADVSREAATSNKIQECISLESHPEALSLTEVSRDDACMTADGNTGILETVSLEGSLEEESIPSTDKTSFVINYQFNNSSQLFFQFNRDKTKSVTLEETNPIQEIIIQWVLRTNSF